MSVRLAIQSRTTRLPQGNAVSGVVRSASSARHPRVGAVLGGRFGRSCRSFPGVGMRPSQRIPARYAAHEAKLSWSFSANTLMGLKPNVPGFTGTTFEADTSAGRRCMR